MRNPVGKIEERPRRTLARLLARYARDARGIGSIEFALIFPVMVIMYFGLIDAGNLLSASRRVTLTASTLADLATQAPGTVTTADLDGFFDAASAIMEPFPASSIALEIFGYKKDGANVKLDWQHKNAAASCGAAPTPDAEMEDLMAEGNDLVVARVCFDWEPITGKIFGMDPIKLEDKLTLRPRQSANLACTNCS